MNYKNIVNGFSILLFLCCSLGYGQNYQSKHFVIHSDMDYRYVNIVQSNIEAYYEQILAMYFAKGWDKPLDIYYSETQSDTQSLIGKYGYNDKIYYGIYLGNMSAIFTHRLMDEGESSGLGTLFHEITHCLVNFNYNTPPVWFNEGLATFLGEQTRMVGDRLILGQPNPWRERALQNMIENGWQVDIKYLFSLSHEQFYAQRDNYHPTRAFFYWLYEKNYLKNYMDNIRLNGYGVSVLEKTVGLTSEQINEELTSFIKANCYPAAYIQNGIFAENKEQKKQCFEAALQIKPSYQPAMLELAICHFQDKDYVMISDNNKIFQRQLKVLYSLYL